MNPALILPTDCVFEFTESNVNTIIKKRTRFENNIAIYFYDERFHVLVSMILYIIAYMNSNCLLVTKNSFNLLSTSLIKKLWVKQKMIVFFRAGPP